MPALEIFMFPCLSDNYGFLIHDPKSLETACIDTPEASKINQALMTQGWKLTDIWNTHHHMDHVGGNLELKQKHKARITGATSDEKRIPAMDRGVKDGDVITLGDHDIHIFETPGHTKNHIIYYAPSAKACFVGDTLFALGCGRLFEGTPAQMFESLSRICALPDETALYCAHEYTLSNAAFAKTIEPANQDLLDYIEIAKAKRAKNIPTVPTHVASEKRANPFIRAKSAKRLGEIRALKDNFRT